MEPDVPPEMRFRNGIRTLPDDLPYGAFIALATGKPVLERGDAWFPPGLLAGLPNSGAAEWHPEGVFLKKPLGMDNRHALVLGTRLPAAYRLPVALRVLLEIVLAGVWFLLSRSLARILLGRQSLRVSLGWQIAWSFVFAGSVPFLTLAFLGASRFVELETVEKARWEGLMHAHLVKKDREFRNQLERLHERCLALVRSLTKGQTTDLSKESLPGEVQSAHTIFFADARKPGFAPRLYSAQAANFDQTLGAEVNKLKRIVLDLLRQILLERGEIQTEPAGNKPQLMAIFLQGTDLAAESARQSRNAWEKRILDRHRAIDRRHLEFQGERSESLRKIERELTSSLPFSPGRLPELCRNLEKYEVVMVDEKGTKMPYIRNFEAIESQGEYPVLMARHLAELIEAEGRVPAPELTGGFVLFPGHQLENVLFTLFRPERTFDRIQAQDRNLIQQPSVLYDPTASHPRAIGLISWAFDEVAFSREFVRRTLRSITVSQTPDDPLRIGFASSEGRFFPREMGSSLALRRMVDRVNRFKAGESELVSFPDGRRYLAVVTFPVELSGYLLIGLLEARPAARIGWAEQAGLILGLEMPFPLEQAEVFALRVLAFSITLSLLLMIPMAIVLSRWVVGRIESLTGLVREIAVLFTHIHHFNDLVGRHPPSELIEMVNEYFTSAGSGGSASPTGT